MPCFCVEKLLPCQQHWSTYLVVVSHAKTFDRSLCPFLSLVKSPWWWAESRGGLEKSQKADGSWEFHGSDWLVATVCVKEWSFRCCLYGLWQRRYGRYLIVVNLADSVEAGWNSFWRPPLSDWLWPRQWLWAGNGWDGDRCVIVRAPFSQLLTNGNHSYPTMMYRAAMSLSPCPFSAGLIWEMSDVAAKF